MSFSNSSGGSGGSGGPVRPKTNIPSSSAPSSGPKPAVSPGLPRPLVTPLAPGAPRPAPSGPRPGGGFGGPRPGGFGGPRPGGFSGPSGPRPGGFGGPRPGGAGGGRGRFDQPRPDEPRMNDRIRVAQVRLIDDEGNQVGVVPTTQALQMARDKGLDLMEVSPNAQPPVCKIVDYGKFKYEKKKKDQVAKKKQTVIKVKEIQLRPQTEEHDLDYKFKNVRQFLEDGDKAKITIMFRGREIAYVDQGYKIMRDLADQVKDVGVVEAPAKLEGKKLIMVLSPASLGGKKPVAPSAPRVVKVDTSAKSAPVAPSQVSAQASVQNTPEAPSAESPAQEQKE